MDAITFTHRRQRTCLRAFRAILGALEKAEGWWQGLGRGGSRWMPPGVGVQEEANG